jgi:hypothetical protein
MIEKVLEVGGREINEAISRNFSGETEKDNKKS